MHRPDVGGRERIGQHADPDPRCSERSQLRNTCRGRHEVRRHDVQARPRQPEPCVHLGHDRRTRHGIAVQLRRRVADEMHRRPFPGATIVERSPPRQPGTHASFERHREPAALDALEQGREREAAGFVRRGQHAVDRISRRARPVTIEIGRDLLDHRADHGDVEVREQSLLGRAEVLVADVATAQDGDAVVGDQRLAVHPAVQAPEVEQVVGPARAAQHEGIDETHRDRRVPVDLEHDPVQAGNPVVIEQQAHPHTPIGRRHQFTQQQCAGGVVAPDVVLRIEGPFGHAHQHRPGRVGVGGLREQAHRRPTLGIAQPVRDRSCDQGVAGERRRDRLGRLARGHRRQRARCKPQHGQARQHPTR